MIEINGILEKLYDRLASSNRISDLCLPPSSAFYVRQALADRLGEDYSLEHVTVALWLEGYISPDSIRRIPDWYVEKYMNGKKPDMKRLREVLEKKFESYRQLVLSEVSSPVSAELAEDNTLPVEQNLT